MENNMKLVTRVFAIFSIAVLVLAAGCGETTDPAPAGGGDTPAAGGDEDGDGGDAGDETSSNEGVSEATTTQVSYTVEGMN